MLARLASVLLVCLLGLGVYPAVAQSTAVAGQPVACANGSAVGYGCNNIDLQALMPLFEIGGSPETNKANDIWGWVDPETQKEYALVGLEEGTAFVDVTDPANPRYLGTLPTHSQRSLWRDVKTYANHAFIVSEASEHGVQVFDLTLLRNVTNPPVTFSETAHYDKVSRVHNIVINEDTGFAYTVGNNGSQEGGCGTGLHIINIQNPIEPTFAGCFSSSVPRRGGLGSGYTHDAQCVVYHGPDETYQGHEICLGADETGVAISDVTNKSAPVELSTATYPDVAYAHQGWLTEDHRYFIQDDELDEVQGNVGNTRTLIWDVMDLDDPQLLTEYLAATHNTDHNLYVRGRYVFQSSYVEGLRILDISDISHPIEVAFFDTVPSEGGPGFNGSWSNYPFFPSGNIVLTSRAEGLFIVRPTAIQVTTEQDEIPAVFTLSAAYPNPFNPATTVSVTLPAAQPLTVGVYDLLGRRVAMLFEGMLEAGTHPLRFEATGLSGGTYVIRAESGQAVVTRQVVLVK